MPDLHPLALSEATERSEKTIYDWQSLVVKLCAAFGEVFPGQLFEEVMDKEFMVTIDELAREALSKDLDLFGECV